MFHSSGERVRSVYYAMPSLQAVTFYVTGGRVFPWLFLCVCMFGEGIAVGPVFRIRFGCQHYRIVTIQLNNLCFSAVSFYPVKLGEKFICGSYY